MKAAQISNYGGPEVLQITKDAPKPHPDAGQILVEVHAASVNAFDWKVREGQARQMAELNFPATLGGDFAGVVAELGEGVTNFGIGDEVYGQANALSGKGSFAEFTPVKAESAGRKPKLVDFVTAAALPLAGVSAYQALVEHANLQKGQKILIHGGAGGLGSFAVQLAKHIGAYVAATAATEDIEFVKNLGADEAIDYRTQDFSTLIKDFDTVFDTVGGETFEKSYQVLKPSGTIVSMVAKENEQLAKQYNVKTISQFTRTTTERLEKLAELVDQGAIDAQIDEIFPIEKAADALEHIKQGHHRGKIVIKIKN